MGHVFLAKTFKLAAFTRQPAGRIGQPFYGWCSGLCKKLQAVLTAFQGKTAEAA